MDNKPNDELPPVELPRPNEASTPVSAEAGADSQFREIDSSRALEQGNPLSGFPAPVAQPVAPLPPSPAQVPLAGVPAVTAAPQIADDSDLIEKEWVDKAKEIVARTKDDPYTQNKELNRIKAEYLKKRYDKDIKLDD